MMKEVGSETLNGDINLYSKFLRKRVNELFFGPDQGLVALAVKTRFGMSGTDFPAQAAADVKVHFTRNAPDMPLGEVYWVQANETRHLVVYLIAQFILIRTVRFREIEMCKNELGINNPR